MKKNSFPITPITVFRFKSLVEVEASTSTFSSSSLKLKLFTSTAAKQLARRSSSLSSVDCENRFLLRSAAFTLLEVLLAMAIVALLAGSIYSITSASIQSTRETIQEQLVMRRLKGFLEITRDAFLNLPANGNVYLTTPNSSNALPDLNFENATAVFGIPSLGGGTLVLSALARNDGTRTFSILRLPKNVQETDRNALSQDEHWIELLPKVNKPHWSFFRNREWVDEWPRGTGRPLLVRLQMEVLGVHNSINSIFYIPPVNAVLLSSQAVRGASINASSTPSSNTPTNSTPLPAEPTSPTR
ncbi:MAG: prepilin-type N-terminal cleavage/methylation domain-containing protein [Chthoniobacterales bacterium]